MPIAAEQETLFPLPEPQHVERSVQDWLDDFNHVAKGKGGLVPVSAMTDLFDVSRQRVHQLIASGRLEKIQYGGVAFVTGRSIKEWKDDRSLGGGPGCKKLGTWKSVVFGAKMGFSIAKGSISQDMR